jgi:hypothetical protein
MRNPKGLRLYKVVTPTTVLYFDNRPDAREARYAELAKGHDDVIVNRGPDHDRGETGADA